MGSSEQLTEYKDSFFRMASSALSASKVGWTRARQVGNVFAVNWLKNWAILEKNQTRGVEDMEFPGVLKK